MGRAVTRPGPVADLLRAAGKDWHITRALGMWCGEKTSGARVHFLVADSATALADKITDADERDEDPGG